VGAGGYAKETEDPGGGAAIASVASSMSAAAALAPRYHPAVRVDMMEKATSRVVFKGNS
jgi:hypothetical protein